MPRKKGNRTQTINNNSRGKNSFLSEKENDIIKKNVGW